MKYISTLSQFIICIFISISILVFLSVNIIDWMYPDESFQYSLVKNRFFGFIFGAFSNWCCVSLGRPTATGWIDLWMSIIQLFNINSIYGFFIYRIVTFISIIFAFYFFIKQHFYTISFLLTFSLTLTIYSIYLLITGTDVFIQIYGLDLALYGIPIAYTIFFIIFALKIHNIDDPKRTDLFLFYLFLGLYLNSVYAHLVTGGLILYFALFTKEKFIEHLKRPLYSFQNIFFHNFWKENYNYLLGRAAIIKPESIFALGFIFYFLSALINLFSPSLAIREEIWPSDTSLLLGFYNSLPVLEGLILNEWSYYYLLITAVVAVLSINNQINISKYSLLLRINLILLAPIIIFLTNALAFTSTTLQGIPPDMIFKNLIFFNHIVQRFDNLAGIATRHLFMYSSLALISYFLIGLELGNLLSKIRIRINNFYIINSFVALIVLITAYSAEFNHFINFAFKKNDEMHARINILKFNHNQFTNARENPQSINFIKEFDYEKGLKSYANAPGRSVSMWFHPHWGLEIGKEIYDVKSDNIFRVSHQVQNYLKQNNINIYEACSEIKNINNVIEKSFEFNNDYFIQKPGAAEINKKLLVFIELEVNSNTQYLNVKTIKKNNKILNTNQIDLTGNINNLIDSYSSNIINESLNNILLDSGSYKDSSRIWFLFYISEFSDFKLEIESLLDRDAYFSSINLKNNRTTDNFINLADKVKILKKKYKIIKC